MDTHSIENNRPRAVKSVKRDVKLVERHHKNLNIFPDQQTGCQKHQARIHKREDTWQEHLKVVKLVGKL